MLTVLTAVPITVPVLIEYTASGMQDTHNSINLQPVVLGSSTDPAEGAASDRLLSTTTLPLTCACHENTDIGKSDQTWVGCAGW